MPGADVLFCCFQIMVVFKCHISVFFQQRTVCAKTEQMQHNDKRRRIIFFILVFLLLCKTGHTGPGVTNKVNKVAKVSPKIMVAAIPRKAISNNRGTMPKMVVVAAISTGRVRDDRRFDDGSVKVDTLTVLYVDFVDEHNDIFDNHTE